MADFGKTKGCQRADPTGSVQLARGHFGKQTRTHAEERRNYPRGTFHGSAPVRTRIRCLERWREGRAAAQFSTAERKESIWHYAIREVLEMSSAKARGAGSPFPFLFWGGEGSVPLRKTVKTWDQCTFNFCLRRNKLFLTKLIYVNDHSHKRESPF
jgi:hypothetical protein